MANEVGTVYTLDTAAAIAALDRLGQSDASFRAQVQQTGAAAAKSFQAAAQAAIDLQNKQAAAQAEVAGTAAVHRELAGVLKDLVQQEKQLEQARKSAAAGGAAAKVKADLEANRREQAKVRTEIELTRRAIESEREAVARVKEETRQQVQAIKLAAAAKRDQVVAEREAAKAAKETTQAQQGQQGSGGPLAGAGGMLGGLLGRLGPAAAGLALVNGLINKTREGINNFANLSGVQATFNAVTGSAAAGAREFAFVKEEARALGLELIPTAKSYTGLLAAAETANIPLAQTRLIFQSVTAAGKTLNISNAEVEGALRAVQQMMSKGTVSAEELRGQLGERLPGAMGIAAKALGVNTQELDKMLRKGEVIAADFLPKFARELQKTYGQGTADAATQLRSNLNRINTFIDESTARIGAAVAPAIGWFAKLVAGSAKASESTQRELVDLELSAQKLRETNVGQKERVELIKQLQEQYPNYLGNLNAETATNEQLSKAIDRVSESLVNKILLQQEEEKISEQATKTADKRRALYEAEVKLRKDLNDVEKQNAEAFRRGAYFKTDTGDKKPVVELGKQNQGKTLLTAVDQTLDFTDAGLTGLSRYNDAYVDLFKSAQAYRKAQADLRAEQQKGSSLEAEKLNLMKALGIQEESNTEVTTGGTDAQKGYIDMLRERVKANTEARDSLAKAGNPNYLAEVGAFNAKIAADNKEIELLTNKGAKGRANAEKKAENELQAALKDLFAKRQKLREEANKLELEQLKEQRRALADATLQRELAAADDLEKSIVEAEKLAAQKGATGLNADGLLTGEQAEEINKVREAAYRRHVETMLDINADEAARMFQAREESNQKELDALETKYSQEQAKYVGNEAVLAALREQYDRERQALLNKQAQERLNQDEAAELALAESAALDFTDPAKQEEVRQQLIFAVKLKYAKKDLELARQIDRQRTTEATRAAVQAAENTYRALQDSAPKEKGAFSIYKLLLGEDSDNEEARAALDSVGKAVADSLAQIAKTQQEAAERRVNDANTIISELSSQLASEVELRKQGAANSVDTLRNQLAEQKQIRREALADQRKAAQAQVIIDAITQASSVATAAAEALAALSGLGPFGFIAGIAAATLIVGSFAAAKVKAFQAAGQIGSNPGFFKGGYTGGNSKHEERGVVHGKEFVHTADTTEKYRMSLFEPLHTGRPQDIDWSAPHMQALLPDFDSPKQLREARQHAIDVRHQVAYQPLQAGLDKLEGRMKAIESNTARLPTKQYVNNPDGSVTEIDLETGSTRTMRSE